MYPQFLLADFEADVSIGNTPLTVNFTNLTSGWPDLSAPIITRSWDFGDGSPFSSDINPIHIYTTGGLFTVTLIETRNFVQSTRTITDYIVVSGEVDFYGVPTKGSVFLTVSFYDTTTGPVDSWYWDFGDGETSTEQNPVHYYPHPGLYTVSLTITNSEGEKTRTKIQYIVVSNSATYDIAPDPAVKLYLWDIGIVNKKDVGVQIRDGFSDGTGFVREQGPSLIFD